MEEKVRTQLGSALPFEEWEGAPAPAHVVHEESMSMGIRNLLLAWGEGRDPRGDDERLAAIRMGPRFVSTSNEGRKQ